jgi:hypothetical protein
MFARRLSALLFAFFVAAPQLRAQSCAAADAAIGATKKHDQLKPSYDKFSDTTSLESKSQTYAFLGQEEDLWVSFSAKHAGQADGPLTTALHLRASHNVSRGTAAQSPDQFSDSTIAIIVADSTRMTLHGGGHRVQRMEFNIIGPPTVDEDVWFPISTEQLAQLARAHAGGIRVGPFDLPMQNKIIETAALAYRTTVCAPSYSAAR